MKTLMISIMATALITTFSASANEDLTAKQVTAISVQKNVEQLNEQLSAQLRQDIQRSLNSMWISSNPHSTVLLAKSKTNKNSTLNPNASEE